MDKIELLKEINSLLYKACNISNNNYGIEPYVINRLREAKKQLKNGKLDCIEFRDIFTLKDEENFKSFKEYREYLGSCVTNIKSFRQIVLFCCNKSNDYKGDYIHIN